MEIEWDRDVQGDYRAQLRIEVVNRPGVLATVAAAIAAAGSNIENVEYTERSPFAATLLWLLVSSVFSLFISNFGQYNQTYGSIGAVIVLLIWFWMSGYMILLGAEINVTRAELRAGRDPRA